MPRADLLLVSLGTTLGWRRADRLFLEQLERAGARAEAVSVSFGLAARLRRGYPVNDLVEMHAARRALLTALARHEPRAIVISSHHRGDGAAAHPDAVRGPARRAGAHEPPRRAQRRPARARAARPRARPADACRWSRAAVDELPAGSAPAMVVSPPVEPSGPPRDERERVAVAYVPDPKAKGLDVLVAGWAAAALPGRAARGVRARSASGRARTCGAPGVPEPTWLELRGTVPAAEFRARIRAARVYAAGARWEDFGQAPLEALADGALLATVPSGGPVRGAAAGARARRARAGRSTPSTARALGERHQGGVRAARRARARLPRRRARAAAPVPARGGPGDRRARGCCRGSSASRLAVDPQDGALPGLGVRARADGAP